MATGRINVPLDDSSITPGPAPSSGDPASIDFTPGQQALYVAGVGRTEMSTLLLTVLDSAGNPINEETYPETVTNNIRVTMITSPGGGEYLSGNALDADGDDIVVDSRATGFIEVRSVDGVIPINLQTGTLPGAVEVKAEVLVDAQGNPLTQPVKANLPTFAIASGPPHTINLTYAGRRRKMLAMGFIVAVRRPWSPTATAIPSRMARLFILVCLIRCSPKVCSSSAEQHRNDACGNSRCQDYP